MHEYTSVDPKPTAPPRTLEIFHSSARIYSCICIYTNTQIYMDVHIHIYICMHKSPSVSPNPIFPPLLSELPHYSAPTSTSMKYHSN